MKTFVNKFGEWAFKTHYIDGGPEVLTAVKELLKTTSTLGLDLETGKATDHEMAGLCPWISKIRLVQIYDDASKTCYVFDLFKVDKSALSEVFRSKKFVAHNGVFEIKHLSHAGFSDLNIGCSMLMSQLVVGAEYSPFEPAPLEEAEDDEDKTGLSMYTKMGHSLDAVVRRLFEIKVEKAYQTSDWNGDLSDNQIIYAALDAVLTLKAAKALIEKVSEYKMQRVYRLLKDMQHVVAHMELVGIPVDWDYHAELIKDWGVKKVAAEKACAPFFGTVNMRSGKQMNEWLKGYLKDQPEVLENWPKTDSGAYAFSKTAIAGYKKLPAVAALLEYKKYAKLLDTYGESLREKKHPLTERLHTSYTLGETRTGRLSSRSPNIQNGPREVSFRNMFKAPEGWTLVVSDFSQIELRLQAEFSKDPKMREAYSLNKDVYKVMASELFKTQIESVNKAQRFIGKTCFSGDTEVLTPDGWVKFCEYTGQSVAQYVLPVGCSVKSSTVQHTRSSRYSQTFRYIEFNGAGGEIQFVQPIDKIIGWDKDIEIIEDRNISIAATEDHVMYWMHPTNKVVTKGTFNTLLNTPRFSVIAAGHLRKEYKLSEIETRILAMVVADGSFCSSNGIRFGFVKRKKIRRCIKLFSEYGIRVSQKTHRSKSTSTGFVTRIDVYDKKLHDLLRNYVTKDKKLSWKCVHDLCGKIYLEEAQFWDSNIVKLDDRVSIRFVSTVEQTVDVMQAMAVTEGVAITKHRNSTAYCLTYPLQTRYKWDVSKKSYRKSTQRNTHVYCVQVPSGLLVLRRNGKVFIQGNCMLALGYGMGPNKLRHYSVNAGVDQPESFWEPAHKAYHSTFETYSRWCWQVRERAKTLGYIDTLLGRRRKLLEDEVYTRAPNTVIQGTAAELMMTALLICYEKIRKYGTIIATVHDEILLCVPNEYAEQAKIDLADSMNTAMERLFPDAASHEVAEAAYATRWGEAKAEL